MPKTGRTIALDIGGTRIKMATIADGEIIQTAVIPAHSEGRLRDRLSDIEQTIQALTGGAVDAYQGIGIAMPCLVDSKRMVATEIYKKFEDTPLLDLHSWSRERFNLPIIMEQDSKAALLGEVHYGSALGYQDVLLIIMGTGVGTAVMLGGKLLDSRNHSAGALGSHVIIEKDGRKCSCNSRGCLEAYTSGWALPGIVREHPGFADSVMAGEEILDFLCLEKAALQGDAVARDVMNSVIRAMRAGIISLVHAYDPAAVIMSGGPLNMGAVFTDPLLCGIHNELWGTGKTVDFKIAERPDESVLLGLHYLMMHAHK